MEIDSIKELKSIVWCEAYVKYIELRIKGLKKPALVSLEHFFNDFKEQNIKSRRYFIEKVNMICFLTNDYSLYLPTNLYRLFNVEIRQWIDDEPHNPVPLIWTRNIISVKQAVIIDPENQIALLILGNLIANKISMNQHELAAGFNYSGSPLEDIELIDFFLSYVDNLHDENERKKLIESLNGLKKCAIENL